VARNLGSPAVVGRAAAAPRKRQSNGESLTGPLATAELRGAARPGEAALSTRHASLTNAEHRNLVVLPSAQGAKAVDAMSCFVAHSAARG
jgi:hypothetical protein